MVDAAGPIWCGGFETITQTEESGRYEVLYLPDRENDALQEAGKSPVFYWLPNAVRIARRGDTGDYKFHLTHFTGRTGGGEEAAGGVLAVTTTAAPPLDVLAASHKQLADKLRGDTRKYWALRGGPAEPQFAPVPISDSRTHMSNLSPRRDGTVPSDPAPAPAPPAGPGTPGTPRSAPASRAFAPRMVRSPRSIPTTRDATPRGLDAWYMQIEGEGPGSLNPAGENAYSALCGTLPAALLWSGFHGTYSPIVVSQSLALKVWSETLHIKIRGNWDRVFEHFSAAAQAKVYWFSADIKAEFNNLRISGGITVEVEIDGTNPGADKMKEEVDKRIDLIVSKFTEQAKARIFDPAPPEVKPADAQGGPLSLFSPYSAGFALKYRRDETKLDLSYDETRQERFTLSTTISSSLEGFYQDIKKDPDAEKKYFDTLYLEDWDTRISHTVKPVVNWPDPVRRWVGDPVAFVGVQIGYPAETGELQWSPHVFESTDTGPTTTWNTWVSKKKAADVANAPQGWAPDISYVKRSVHFTEPPSATENPFVRCQIEKEVVQLDDGPNGTATNDLNLEVRADNAGKLDVGPISLSALLEGAAQTVEVECQALGTTDDGTERPVVRFAFKATDQDEARYWTVFTGQKSFLPRYRYRVHVVIRGGLTTQGKEWWGAWTETSGNGPLMVMVPTEEESVQTRSLVPGARPAGSPTTGNGRPSTTPIGRPGAEVTRDVQGFGLGGRPGERGTATGPERSVPATSWPVFVPVQDADSAERAVPTG